MQSSRAIQSSKKNVKHQVKVLLFGACIDHTRHLLSVYTESNEELNCQVQ